MLYTIRSAIPDDLPHLLALERLSQSYDCWHADDFLSLISLPPLDPTYHLSVLCPAHQPPIAYLSAFTVKRTTQLLALTVHPAHRRQGLASALLASLLPSTKRLVAHVRARDLDAQLFLSACSLRCTRILPSHFVDPPDDGYRFVASG